MNAMIFEGTGESCSAVTELIGGHDPAKCLWKSCTYDGGYLVTPKGAVEFVKGDWIAKGLNGSLHVLTDPFGYAERKSGPMRDLIVAFLGGEVSMGRICEVSGLDRDAVCYLRDHLVKRGMRAAGMSPPDDYVNPTN